MKRMTALTISAPHLFEIMQVEVPAPKPGEVLVKVMASGICGTDVHILEGEYLGGYPVIPGHEYSGIVEQTGEGVSRFKVGDRVAIEPNIACDNCEFCLNNQQNFCRNWKATGVTLPGGMAQYVCVEEKAVFDIGTLSFDEGAFVEPLSCVLHGASKLNIRPSDSVLIIGSGPIGMLIVQVVKNMGASRIDVVDPDLNRLQVCAKVGATSTYSSLEQVKKEIHNIVIDATGIPSLMSKTVDYVKQGGRILLFGVPPKVNVEFDAFKMFTKGLSMMTSYTSVRNSLQAVDMLSTGQVDVRPLISHKLPLTDFGKAIDIIKTKKENVLKVLLCPND